MNFAEPMEASSVLPELLSTEIFQWSPRMPNGIVSMLNTYVVEFAVVANVPRSVAFVEFASSYVVPASPVRKRKTDTEPVDDVLAEFVFTVTWISAPIKRFVELSMALDVAKLPFVTEVSVMVMLWLVVYAVLIVAIGFSS